MNKAEEFYRRKYPSVKKLTWMDKEILEILTEFETELNTEKNNVVKSNVVKSSYCKCGHAVKDVITKVLLCRHCLETIEQ